MAKSKHSRRRLVAAGVVVVGVAGATALYLTHRGGGGLTVSATANPTSAKVGQMVSFSAKASGGQAPYTYQWAFGDGITGSGVAATHSYSTPGSYTVVVAMTDSQGNTAQGTATVAVTSDGGGGGGGTLASLSLTAQTLTPSPGAFDVFTVTALDSAGSPVAGASATLAVKDSGGNTIKTYSLLPTDATGQAIAQVGFTTAGTYSVVAAVGTVSSNTVTITVSSGGGGGSFSVKATATPTSGVAPLAVQFVATVQNTGGQTVNYQWDFGDGSQGFNANASHTYASAGSYTATVTAYIQSTNQRSQDTVQITVSAPPTLSSIRLNASGTSITPGTAVGFQIVAADSAGNLMAGVSAKLYQNGSPVATFPSTDLNGTATLTLQFNTQGTFAMQAVSNSIQSNIVSVTASNPPPTYPLSILSAAQVSISGTPYLKAQIQNATSSAIQGILYATFNLAYPTTASFTIGAGSTVYAYISLAGLLAGSWTARLECLDSSGTTVISPTVQATVTITTTGNPLTILSATQVSIGGSPYLQVGIQNNTSAPVSGVLYATFNSAYPTTGSFTLAAGAAYYAYISLLGLQVGTWTVALECLNSAGTTVLSNVFSTTVTIGGGTASATVSFFLTDSSEPYATRIWAVFIDRPPGSYLGGGKWAAGNPDASGTNVQSVVDGATISNLARGAHTLYLVVSVPDTGYGSYSVVGGTINGASFSMSGITESHPGQTGFTV